MASAGSFSVGAALPLSVVAIAPAQYLIAAIAVAGLACLLFLGGWSAKVGGANVRVGALARGILECTGDGGDHGRRRGRGPAVNCALFSAAQMNEADRLAMAAGTPGVLLMQTRGRGGGARDRTPLYPAAVTVLCGPGNNGGDGFVVAAKLAQSGWPVRVALLGGVDALRADALHHARRWQGNVEPLAPGGHRKCRAGDRRTVWFRPESALAGVCRRLAGLCARRGVPIVAVDIPSGIVGDSGENWGAAAAMCTVTFVRKKPGHLLLPGRDLCGDVVVADIGIPQAVLDSLGIDTWENTPALWRSKLPQVHASGNKYSRGHALLYGGYPMTGAARMAARAAARSGAGLTTIAVPAQAFAIYAAALTSIMVQPLNADQDLSELLEDRRYTAFSIGPGAGVNDATRARALAMLATGRAGRARCGCHQRIRVAPGGIVSGHPRTVRDHPA